MKLANLSQHPLAIAFLARGRSWLAQAKPHRRKTEVLPPDAELSNNPCYRGTLAMYAKGVHQATDAVTILDVGDRLVCTGVGDGSTTGTSRVNTEYGGQPAVATLAVVNSAAMTLRLIVTVAGVEQVNKVIALVDDLPASFAAQFYGKQTRALVASSRGVAVWRHEDDGVSLARRTAYWLDAAAIVAVGVASTTVGFSVAAGTPVIDDLQTNGDFDFGGYAWTLWAANDEIFLLRDGGAVWPGAGNSAVKDSRIVSEHGVKYITSGDISRIEYECDGASMLFLEFLTTGDAPGTIGTYQSDIRLVRHDTEGDTEAHVGVQTTTITGAAGSGSIVFDYPVYRGGVEPNVVAHHDMQYVGLGVTSLSNSITINGTLYTYDVDPADSGPNKPMSALSTYNGFYAGKVTVGDTEVDALVAAVFPAKGYVAGSGNVLVSVPVATSTTRVCSLNGSITMLDNGTLEFKPPYRAIRIISV